MRNVIIFALLYGCLLWQQAEGLISEGKRTRATGGGLVIISALNFLHPVGKIGPALLRDSW